MVCGESALGALPCTRCEEAVVRQEGGGRVRRRRDPGLKGSTPTASLDSSAFSLLHLARPHLRCPPLLWSGYLQGSQVLPEEGTQQTSLKRIVFMTNILKWAAVLPRHPTVLSRSTCSPQ